MKLDLNKPILDLEGIPLKEKEDKNFTMARALANQLVLAVKGDAVKFYDWGLTFYKIGIIEIDEADMAILENFVKDLQVSNLVKGQIIKEIKSNKK